MQPGRSVARRLDWVEYTRRAAAAGQGVYLVIVEEATGELLGACDLRFPDPEDARIGELGYLLVEGARGRGVMQAALRLLVRWGFEHVGLARVQAMTHPGNAASMRVLERLGFTREGVLRSYRADVGGREDRVVFSLLPGELPAESTGELRPAT